MSESLWTGQQLIFLDGDPVYTFGLRAIVAYVLLMHVDYHSIVVTRRLLSMYLIWAIICFLFFVRAVFYPLTIAVKCVDCTQLIDIFVEEDHSFYLEWTLYFMLVYPLLLTILQLIFLCPILTRKESLSEVLFWEEDKTSLGRFMLKSADSTSLHRYDQQCFEMRLYKNLTQRLGYLIKSKFYVYMFDCFLVETPKCLKQGWGLPFYHSARRQSNIECSEQDKARSSQYVLNQLQELMITFLLMVWYLIKLPIVTVVTPFIILPLFCLLSGLVNSPRILLGNCSSKSGYCCCRSGSLCCKMPLFFVGFILTVCKFWFLIYLLLYMGTFILIDIIRNIRTSLPQLIFFFSIMIYIRNAFVQFEDDFRTLKAQTFKAILQLEEENLNNEEESQEDKHKSFPLMKLQNGDIAIPKCVFYQVSEDQMPYGQSVCKMLTKFFSHLLIISFLFVIIIDFQVLDQFSELGESFITIITVSLPGLFGQIKSEGHKSLQDDQQFNRIKTSLSKLIEDKCFWKEQSNKVKRKASQIPVEQINIMS